MAEDLTWQRILHGYSSRLLKFIINFRSSTLPSPGNLSRWGKGANHSCGLCNEEKATISHTMNFCPWVRKQSKIGVEDRYTWRHNCVLSVLINHIAAAIKRRQTDVISSVNKGIRFVKSGWQPKVRQDKPKRYGLEDKAHD